MSDSKITALTAHTALIDTDVLPVVDITAVATKKTTWSNIKSVLKTYFDTLYGNVSKVGTPVNNQVGVWTGDGTLEGDANLTWTGTGLAVQGSAVFNESGADVDFRVEGTGRVNALFVDGTNGNVGVNTSTPQESLHVVDGILLEHTGTAGGDHAFEIAYNAAGFGDGKAVDIAYTTGAIALGQDEEAILVNFIESSATGGNLAALEVLTTTNGATSNVYGLKTGIDVAPIDQSSGTFGNATSLLNKAVNVLTELSSGGAGNISVFVADNDTITIGSSAKFEEIEFIVDTPSSQSITPTFEFSTGVGTWATFTPTDGTNGFRNTGEVLFDDADIPTWAVGTGSEYLIRITRTRNTITTTPILDLIQISAVTKYSWDKNGVIKVASIELGHATDTTISRSSAGVIAVEGVTVPTISSTSTLTNKRITKRTGTTTSHATPTINTDNVDEYYITAQAEAITSFTTNLSGTPTEGQTLFIAITGTAARAITWGASFENGPVALPTTTVTTTRLDTLFKWNTVTSKWRCMATGSTV